MKYIEIRIITEQNRLESIAEQLYDMGISSAIINDPEEFSNMLDNLDETEWYDKSAVSDDWKELMEEAENSPSVTVYLPWDDEGFAKLDAIRSVFPDSIIREVDDGDWKDKWKEYFTPTLVTPGILVAPSWSTDSEIAEALDAISADSIGAPLPAEDSSAPIVVRIDPGQAFGTGTHETTSLTIKLMEKYMRTGERVLDIGTGSGILAIIATKLGASTVLGIDIDEESVAVANKNIRLNLGTAQAADFDASSVTAIPGDLTAGVDFTADIIVANLLHDLVIRLSKDAAKHLAPGGIYISSGILTEKEPLVAEAIREAGFEILEIIRDGEWSSIAATTTPL